MAVKYPSKTPERDILRMVRDYLNLHRILYFRVNSGAVKIHKRFIRFGTPGAPDVLAFKKGWNPKSGAFHAQAYAIECKTSTGVQSVHQYAFQKEFEKVGGVYAIVRNLQDLERVFA